MRHLRRRPDRALLGGVCAGVADALDAPPLLVRGVFVILAFATGIGVLAYPVAWALLPVEGEPEARTWRERLAGWRQALAIVLLAGAITFGLRHAGLWLGQSLLAPLVLVSAGVALILRPGAARGATAARGSWRAGLGRWPAGILGAVLILAGAFTYLGETGLFRHDHSRAGGGVFIAVVVGLLLLPWLGRLARSLADERAERIRSQERADVAAHLHDSVLQTLALIQRRAEDPRQVLTLARRQERELRRWLFERRDGEHPATLGHALDQVVADTEALYDVRVESASAGDCPLDEHLSAIVAAAREALTNAAKFAGDARIDIFSEVDQRSVCVWVRDRGAGFDLATVPEDRRGVRHSIIERMRQHGGSAQIRTGLGTGTEVELRMEQARS